MVETGIVNALFQGVVTGGIIAAGALGLSLVYSIAEVPNFAHGDMLTVGAYLALALNSPGELVLVPNVLELPFAAAAIGSVALAGVLGGVYEKTVFKQFRGKDADLITMVIVSLGLALVLRNLVLFLVGTQNVTYDTVRRVNVNVDLYVTGGGVAVELNQRANGALQALDSWGYSWPVVIAGLLVAVGVGLAVYRWRRSDQSFEKVHFVSPWIWGVSAGAVALAAVAMLARGAPLSVADAVYSTRVGVSQKYGIIVAVMVATMLCMNYVLKRTKTGRAMRATADDQALARVRGVDIDRVQLVVWVLAAVLAAIAGVLLGWYASNLSPNMGFNLLLPVFAAVIVGGIDSPYGAALGGLLIGISMDVGVYLLPSGFATYRTAIAFVILVAVLLVKPEGLWGDS
ncbi:branched-chain amino acid ABC transporter permease [Halobacterium bonnevillei]|uniref:Branched-chain amino acid ABC transporter permease n=1 Tax=Halobacterium bonnevillei TaxID=2692200 RepID=A0A6B0SYP7_9EURY|nr:branched-chain amino acid ABC transporter permease [Halobacterium bonnevillei]MXR22469.1 branched-chain amino acid ABC transporter permease [Halobacterium bonnevillei]